MASCVKISIFNLRKMKISASTLHTSCSVRKKDDSNKKGLDLSNFIKTVGGKQPTKEQILKGEQLVNAADAVSKVLGGEQVKSDLLKKLMSLEKETADAAKSGLAATLSSMTVESVQKTADQQLDRFNKYKDQFLPKEWSHDDSPGDLARLRPSSEMLDVDGEQRSPFRRFADDALPEGADQSVDQSRPDQKRRWTQSTRQQQEVADRESLTRMKESMTETYPEINLLDGPRLDIFKCADLPEKSLSYMDTWEKLEKRHLHWLKNEAPRNGFEEMILWTEQGRMYPYPIDNEFGFFEKHVGFHEHVFLDRLTKDFPKTGPLRRFIDLVAIGLSKNPYMSVEKKREHIEWFRDYFKDRHEELEKLRLADQEERALRKMKK